MAATVAAVFVLFPATPRIVVTSDDGILSVTTSFRMDVALASPEFPQVAAVNGGNNNSNATSHTVNLPSGIASGDLLLVFFASDGSPTITFPNEGTDWIQLFETARGTAVKFSACYRIANGTEGNTITVTTSASERTAHTSYRITGYSGIPVCGTSATGNNTTPNPPSLSPSWGAKDTLWFTCCGYDQGQGTVSTYPTNYTNGRNDRSNNTQGCGVGSAHRELNAASEDPEMFTISLSEQWVAQTVAVQPTAVADISNTPSSKSFGTVIQSYSYWSNGGTPAFPLDDSECYFTITNNGSTSCSITIQATNFTGGAGWTLTSGSPGENTVRVKVGKSGDSTEDDMVILTTSDQSFISNLGASNSRKWEIKLETGTFTDGVDKSSIITLTASAT